MNRKKTPSALKKAVRTPEFRQRRHKDKKNDYSRTTENRKWQRELFP